MKAFQEYRDDRFRCKCCQIICEPMIRVNLKNVGDLKLNKDNLKLSLGKNERTD